MIQWPVDLDGNGCRPRRTKIGEQHVARQRAAASVVKAYVNHARRVNVGVGLLTPTATSIESGQGP